MSKDRETPPSRSASSSSSAATKPTESTRRTSREQAESALFVPHREDFETALERTRAAGGDEYTAMLESICGATDDSQPVEQYDGTLGVTTGFVNAHQSAVCQVHWNDNLATVYSDPGNVSGVRWGTGTMITDDLMIACGHLFDQTGGGWDRPRTNGTTNIISPQEIATNMRVNFNYQVDAAGNPRAEQSFPILQLIEYRLGGLDMAICRIGGNPGATFGRTQISPTDAAAPEMICIIGHPAGLRKRIEAGPVTTIAGDLIRYNDIDTLGGNSGSGILRASDGRLVGIHTNGGCNAAGTGSNFGQRIAAVIAASPTLTSLLRPKHKFVDDVAKFKVFDDGPSKFKILDDPVTLKFRDDGGKLKLFDDPGTVKFRDDIKRPGLDKMPGFEGKAPAFDGIGGFGQPIPREGPSARPFILSTPHHSSAWCETVQPTSRLSAMEAAILQMEHALSAGAAELGRLDAEYRQLIAEYVAAGGQLA